jgi:hypothetical protein
VRHVDEIRVEAVLSGWLRGQLKKALNTGHVQDAVGLAALAQDGLVLQIQKSVAPQCVSEEIEDIVEGPLAEGCVERLIETVAFVQPKKRKELDVKFSAGVPEVNAIHLQQSDRDFVAFCIRKIHGVLALAPVRQLG